MIVCDQAIKKLGMNRESCRVIVQGFGNVGSNAAKLDVPAHPKNVLLASLPDERLIERNRDYPQLARSHGLTPCAGRIGRLAYENCRS